MLVICSISIHLSFTSIPPPLVHVVIGLIRFSVHLGLPSSSLLPSIGKSSPHFLFHASLLYSLSALLWCYLSLLLSDYFFSLTLPAFFHPCLLLPSLLPSYLPYLPVSFLHQRSTFIIAPGIFISKPCLKTRDAGVPADIFA